MGLKDTIRKALGIDELKESLNKELGDIKLSVGATQASQAELAQVIKTKRRTLSKPLMYSNPVGASPFDRSRNKTYHGPMYDLAEIGRIMDIEAYVNQSVRKHREQILKEGYFFTGEDEEMVEYIKRRIFEIEMASGYVFEEIIRDFATSLVAYGTSFLVFKRDKTKSTGLRTRRYGKTMDPIAAVYHMDPTCVSAKVNEYGHVTRWKQKLENAIGGENEKYFAADEVVAATVDRKPGFVFGTPYILPVIDDVRALRKLEELAEIIARKHAFPSVHWKVGDANDPATHFEDNMTEISYVRNEVESMTPEGGIVTSYRVDHEVVAAKDGMLDLTPLIEYYEARVLGGLRLSPVDLGRGDVSKASAGATSKSLRDSSKDFQAIIEAKISYELCLPLLLEGGYNVNRENMVHFKFPMIDREEERAHQQHGADLCNSSVITYTEFRRDFMGKKAMTDEEMKDTKDLMSHDRDKELAEHTAANKAQQSGTEKKSDAAKNATQNKVRPKNQNGRKPSKTAITANNNLEDQKAIYRFSIMDSLAELEEHLTSDSVLTDDLSLHEIADSVISQNKELIGMVMDLGVCDALLQLGITDKYEIPKRSVDRFFRNYVRKTLFNQLDGAKEWMKSHADTMTPAKASVIMEQLNEDIQFLMDRHIDIAYRFGFVRALRNNGVDKADLVPIPENACDACKQRGAIELSIADKDIPYSHLLRTHGSCGFNMELHREV